MNTKGFTLIELLVSVGIFTVVMTVALGALLSVAESDRKAQTLKTITNNLGFALESMSRNIRTGKDYACNQWESPAGCSTGGAWFTYTDVYRSAAAGEDVRVGYRYADSSSGCDNGIGCIQRSVNGGDWEDVTAPEVVIEDLKFYLIGSARGADTQQPRVNITATGYVQISESQRSTFNIQTTVTQRLYDQ